jgi:2-C-methyl-D-erythritol 4-phosphate cytidylyltransferase
LALLCIHDAARPLVTAEAIDRAIERAAVHGAAMVALPLADSLHRATRTNDETSAAFESLDRSGLWLAQTPQCFVAEDYRRVLARAAADGRPPTDDAALWQQHMGPVVLVPGDPSFLKVTTAKDLELVEALLARRAAHGTPTMQEPNP